MTSDLCVAEWLERQIKHKFSGTKCTHLINLTVVTIEEKVILKQRLITLGHTLVS